MHMPAMASAALAAGLMFCLLSPALAAVSAADSLAAVKSGKAQMNGVNLGSWLLCEQWMSPEVYKTVKGAPYGELQLMVAARKQGRTSAVRAKIQNHRQTWVTEGHFAYMYEHGINAVRIPVGYWVMASTTWQANPFVENGFHYLDKAFAWGAKYGIGVLLDLHAAPGSQNGYDNSAPEVKGRVMWDQKASYQARSVAVIEAMAARYGRRTALLGFGLLNEPIVNSGPLQAYYKAAYAAVRKHSSSCFVAIAPRVYEQDGSEWQHFMAGSGYTNVLQDLHRYQTSFAGPQFSSLSVQQQVQYAQNQKGQLASYIKGGGLKPMIGEWALAGPNYNFNGQQSGQIASFYEAQRAAYLQSGSAGWFQWSLKNSYNNDVWNFESAVKYGWLHK